MTKTESQKAPDPEPWRVLVDAKFEIARTLRPEAWLRYIVIALELEGPPVETAARRLLSRVRSPWEGVDWDAALATAGPSRRRTPVSPPMTRVEGRRLELMRECLRLEAEFDAVLVAELQAERWEGESAAGPITTATWFVVELTFDMADNAVQPGSAPRLLGIRLRRKLAGVAPERAPSKQSADLAKKSGAETALTDGDTRRHTGSETPVADPITQARLALLRDIIKPKMKPKERRRTAVRRLLKEGIIKELPGYGTEDTALREITRREVWDRVVEVKPGIWQIT